MADIKPRLAASFSQPQRHSHSHTASRRARARRRPGGARAARARRRGLGSAGRCERPERAQQRGKARSCRSRIGAPRSGAQAGAKGVLISLSSIATPAERCRGAVLRSYRGEEVGAAPSPSPRGKPPPEPRLTMTALETWARGAGRCRSQPFRPLGGRTAGQRRRARNSPRPGRAAERRRASEGSERGAARERPSPQGPAAGPHRPHGAVLARAAKPSSRPCSIKGEHGHLPENGEEP